MSRALPGPPCGVGVALAALPGEEATELADLLAGGARLTALSEVLARRGHELSPFMLGWHRRGRCSCARRKVAA